MKLTMSQFKGAAPKIDSALLPDDMSQIARNVSLFSGIIVPEKRDKVVKQVTENTESIYLYTYKDVSKWYTWDKKVRVIKDFIYQDEYERIIVQGAEEELLITDSTLLEKSPLETINKTNSYLLGIPRLDSFTMEVIGEGTENIETRSYVVALVRTWQDGKVDIGGLSEPAKTADGSITVNVATGQSVQLSNIIVPTHIQNDTGATQLYIYRTEVGTDTVGYSYVTTFDLAPDITEYSFTDSLDSTELGESAVSQAWDSPETNLRGMVSLSNGVMACFKNQTVYFSYPYQPYAFPATYTVTVDSPIVGLGAFGNTVVVGTTSNPVMILVADPAAPSVTPIQTPIPCYNEESIVNTLSGVLYITNLGIAQIDNYSYDIITKDITSPSVYYNNDLTKAKATLHDNFYHILFGDVSSGAGAKLNIDNISEGFTSTSYVYKLFWVDNSTNTLYAVGQDPVTLDWNILHIQGDEKFNKTCVWKSKLFISNGIYTFSAARLDSDFDATVEEVPELRYSPASNSLNTNAIHVIGINDTVNNQNYIDAIGLQNTIVFSYYVDKKLKFVKYVNSNRPFRLPSGFMGRRFEVQVESTKPIRSIALATSIGELQ